MTHRAAPTRAGLRRRRGQSVIVAFATLALLLTACGSDSESDGPKKTPSSARAELLTVAATANITTWDPVKSFSTEALYMANVYEPLLWKNGPDAADEYTPALAETWESSADAKTWTFHLRSGATFHDGTPVDAAAVKASIEAAKDHGGASFIWAPVDSIAAPDPQTVVFTLSYAAPLDLVASSTYGAWIVSPAALEASAKDDTYFESGVDAGSGPYTVESYTPDKEVVLKAYDGHWGTEKPAYKRVIVSLTADASTQQQQLTSGEVDLALSIPLENVGQLADSGDFELRDYPAPFSYVGFFNTTRPPLDDPKVRQALSYAMPYQDIIEVGAQGYGTQSRGPVPDGIFPFDPATPQYSQDLDKAKALLADAGHADGLDLTLTYAAENQNEKRFVPLIKDAFAKIGVNLTTKAMLFNQQWEKGKGNPKKAQDIFVVLYWPTYSDAGSDNLYSLFHSSDAPFFNLSYWKNAEYDGLIDDAGKLTGSDREAAQAKYSESMRLLYDQAPGFFLYDAKQVYVVPKDLEGFDFNINYPFSVFFSQLKPA